METQRAITAESLLAMAIFNNSTAGVIFAQKILCLLGSCFGMYFFVRLVFMEPVVAFLFFILMLNATTFYCVLWNNVDAIPEKVRSFRRQLNIKTALRGRDDMRYYTRVGTMRCQGIRVVTFRYMEQNSALIFLDFVGSNVANMLISF